MKIYRATDEIQNPIPAWQCWALKIDDAIAYLDNPGYGGKKLYEAYVETENLRILDLREPNSKIWSILSSILNKDVSSYDYGRVYYVWENSKKNSDIISSLYDAIIYYDDYPEYGETIVFTKSVAPLYIKRII